MPSLEPPAAKRLVAPSQCLVGSSIPAGRYSWASISLSGDYRSLSAEGPDLYATNTDYVGTTCTSFSYLVRSRLALGTLTYSLHPFEPVAVGMHLEAAKFLKCARLLNLDQGIFSRI